MEKKQAALFDLDGLEANTDTVTIQLLHPITGEEIGATATIYGQDSDIAKAESHKISDKCAEYSRRNRGKAIPNEDYAKLDRQKIIKCTKSIDGLGYKGEPLTDTGEIFDRFPWVLEQVIAAHLDRKLFTKGSSTR